MNARHAARLAGLLLLLLLLCAPQAAAEGPGAVVRIVPAQAEVGEELTTAVEVRVEGVQALYGFDIRLAFDPTVVQVVDADPATAGTQVRPGDLLQLDLVARNVADNDAGSIWFAMTQANPNPEVSGSGVAFTVTLRGRAGGERSPLAITYIKLATRDGQAIPAEEQAGEINVVPALQAPATPTPGPPMARPALEQTALAPTATAMPLPPLGDTAAPDDARTPLPTLLAAAAGGLLVLGFDGWRRRRARRPA